MHFNKLLTIVFCSLIHSAPIPKKELKDKIFNDFVIENHRIHQLDIKIEYEATKQEKIEQPKIEKIELVKAERVEKPGKPEKVEKVG